MRNFVLFVGAILLVMFSVIVGVPAKVIQAFHKKSSLNDWFLRLAKSLDQFANVVGDDFYQIALTKSDRFARFGHEDELISSVIGKNDFIDNLTLLGKLVNKILHFFDANHSVKSIEKDEGYTS